jgi:hypothetical protein
MYPKQVCALFVASEQSLSKVDIRPFYGNQSFPDSWVSVLPRSVTVAQVILDHFVMVRIHARQPSLVKDSQTMASLKSGSVIRSVIRSGKENEDEL